jgi:hypothetical protein
MASKLARKFDSVSFQAQIVVLAAVLDPLGFVAGYLLAPAFDAEPLIGGVVGLVAASVPTSLFVMRRAAENR